MSPVLFPTKHQFMGVRNRIHQPCRHLQAMAKRLDQLRTAEIDSIESNIHWLRPVTPL